MILGEMRLSGWMFLAISWALVSLEGAASHRDQPLSRIVIDRAVVAPEDRAFVKASPSILGLGWAKTLNGASTCLPENPRTGPPFLCTAPIKYQYANYTNPKYKDNGKGMLKLQLIKQRSDFSFVLFSGRLSNPKLVAVSNTITFANPNSPVYPRLAQGKMWNEMTVTWTSGYGINEAEPFVEWGPQGGEQRQSPAGTLTFDRNSMCDAPARTVGWRDPGFIHTSFLKELDMGKDEADGSNEYNNFQHGSLNTTKQLIRDLENIDIVFHIGDICYANAIFRSGINLLHKLSQLPQLCLTWLRGFGNHERDWPGTGSFYGNMDSGGECGVLAETMFYVSAENRDKFWLYSTDYGMFRFCIADTEHDWREGTEQFNFIQHCLASVDRQKQPWLIFLAHRVLGYSSVDWYADEGSFEEPMGRESLQKLWQKYKVDIAIYGHVHNYERTCPIYQKHYYKGGLNGTIHIVAGGGADFTSLQTKWSVFKDHDYGFVKLTAFDHSNLLFEYKKSRDGNVYDSFRISRDYRDILACTVDSCPSTTLAS
ncbi:unnamed protein product [Camellia sinensis]